MARAFQQRMLCELDCLSEQELQSKLKLPSREMADVKAKPDKLSEKGNSMFIVCSGSSNLGGVKYSKRRGTAFGSSLSATHAVRA